LDGSIKNKLTCFVYAVLLFHTYKNAPAFFRVKHCHLASVDTFSMIEQDIMRATLTRLNSKSTGFGSSSKLQKLFVFVLNKNIFLGRINELN